MTRRQRRRLFDLRRTGGEVPRDLVGAEGPRIERDQRDLAAPGAVAADFVPDDEPAVVGPAVHVAGDGVGGHFLAVEGEADDAIGSARGDEVRRPMDGGAVRGRRGGGAVVAGGARPQTELEAPFFLDEREAALARVERQANDPRRAGLLPLGRRDPDLERELLRLPEGLREALRRAVRGDHDRKIEPHPAGLEAHPLRLVDPQIDPLADTGPVGEHPLHQRLEGIEHLKAVDDPLGRLGAPGRGGGDRRDHADEHGRPNRAAEEGVARQRREGKRGHGSAEESNGPNPPP